MMVPGQFCFDLIRIKLSSVARRSNTNRQHGKKGTYFCISAADLLIPRHSRMIRPVTAMVMRKRVRVSRTTSALHGGNLALADFHVTPTPPLGRSMAAVGIVFFCKKEKERRVEQGGKKKKKKLLAAWSTTGRPVHPTATVLRGDVSFPNRYVQQQTVLGEADHPQRRLTMESGTGETMTGRWGMMERRGKERRTTFAVVRLVRRQSSRSRRGESGEV